MINSIRTTVLAILNKNNFGYVSPEDFNLFAKQAQLDIFESYFRNYNKAITDENTRKSGSDIGNMSKMAAEAIGVFTREEVTLTRDVDNKYFLPSLATTGDDYYYIRSMSVFNSSGAFLSYAERVELSKIRTLLASPLTSPTLVWPYYTQEGGRVAMYPSDINQNGLVKCTYVRYPKDPKWTYTIVAGAPIFNQSAVDYQDIELPIEDEIRLVVKILQYAGISIRENDVYSFAKREELEDNQGM
jgi:hypothetical protein